MLALLFLLNFWKSGWGCYGYTIGNEGKVGVSDAVAAVCWLDQVVVLVRGSGFPFFKSGFLGMEGEPVLT